MRLLLGLVCSLVCFACQRPDFKPDAIEQDYLTLGKGGGMTNQVDTYYVLADGYVHHHDQLTKTYEPLGRLDKADRTRTFAQATALADSLNDYQEPGNLYYFLTIHRPDTTRSFTWGNRHAPPPEAVSSLYQQIQQSIQALPQ